jgi:flagellar biogenesis protein FliO
LSAYTSYIVETFVTLAVVCALAAAILWGARRMGVTRGSSGPIELCARLQLDTRRAIYLVKIGDVAFVLAASEVGLVKIGEIPFKDLGGAEVSRGGAFADVLARAWRGGGGDTTRPPTAHSTGERSQ